MKVIYPMMDSILGKTWLMIYLSDVLPAVMVLWKYLACKPPSLVLQLIKFYGDHMEMVGCSIYIFMWYIKHDNSVIIPLKHIANTQTVTNEFPNTTWPATVVSKAYIEGILLKGPSGFPQTRLEKFQWFFNDISRQNFHDNSVCHKTEKHRTTC